MATQAPTKEQHAPVVEATKARSGRPGVPILWILIVSMSLVAIGFVVLLALQGPSLSGQGGQSQATQPTVSQMQSPPQPTTSKPAN